MAEQKKPNQQNKPQNKQQQQRQQQQQQQKNGWIDELDGKYVEATIVYGSTIQKIRGTLRVARYDVKIETLDSRTQKVINVYVNKAYLVSVVPV